MRQFFSISSVYDNDITKNHLEVLNSGRMDITATSKVKFIIKMVWLDDHFDLLICERKKCDRLMKAFLQP